MSTANVPDLASPIELDERYRTGQVWHVGGGHISAVRQGGGRHMEYMVLGTLMNIYFLALAHADLLEG
jgi:hypothetical protein